MLSYETCLKLKEAGFKQFGDGWALIPNGEETISAIPWCQYVYKPNHELLVVYRPTLSELIEECGKSFNYLLQRQEGWIATDYLDQQMTTYGEGKGFGNTPEEAVSALYLDTKKKK